MNTSRRATTGFLLVSSVIVAAACSSEDGLVTPVVTLDGGTSNSNDSSADDGSTSIVEGDGATTDEAGNVEDASSTSDASSTADASTDASLVTDGSALGDASVDSGADSGADAGLTPGQVTFSTYGAQAFVVGTTAKANVTWAAWQDGNGAWTTLSPSSTGTYVFTTTSTRYAIAYLCANVGDTQSDGALLYKTTAVKQVNVYAGSLCAPGVVPTTHAVSGTLSNIPAGSLAYGAASDYSSVYGSLGGATTKAYSLPSVSDATHDFFFSTSNAAGALDRIVTKRGQLINADKVIDADFTGALTATSHTANVAGIGVTDTTNLTLQYVVGSAEIGLSVLATPLIPASAGFGGIPIALKQGGDHYLYALDTYGVQTTTRQERSYRRDFADAATFSVSLPADWTTPTYSNAATGPYSRFDLLVPYVGTAQGYTLDWNYSPGKGAYHNFTVSIDAWWMPAGTSYSYTVPDFSLLAGWKNAWAAPSGTATGAHVTAWWKTSNAGVSETFTIAKRFL